MKAPFSTLCLLALGAHTSFAAPPAKPQPTPRPTPVPAGAPRKDWLGTSFVENKAPVLAYRDHTAPRPMGNDYVFPPQTARNVINFRRFPEFKLHPSKKVVWWGPLYTDNADNLHFTRGVTHLCNHPKYREKLTEMQVPAERLTSWFEGMERLAGIVAENLKRANPDDPRVPWLEDWAKDQRLMDNREACHALGAFTWGDVMSSTKGKGAELITIDIESYKPSTRSKNEVQSQYHNMLGWVYEGLVQEARKNNKITRVTTYSQGLGGYSSLHYSGDPGNWGPPAPPAYLHPKGILAAFSGGEPVHTDKPTAKIILETKGFVTEDAYQRQTYYDHLYQQKPDGSLIVEKDKPVFRDDDAKQDAYGIKIGVTGKDTRSTVGGNALESRAYLDTIYQKAQQLWTNTYWAAGGKMPELNTTRQPGLENLQLGSMMRHDTESFGICVGADRNGDRPLNPHQIEGIEMLQLLLGDLAEFWSSEIRVQPIGSEVKYRYGLDGPYEYATKANHRLSEFNFIFDQPYKPIFPKLLLVSTKGNTDQFYHERPIVIGGTFARGGQPYCWLFWWFPANIGRGALDAKVWFDNGKNKSPAYPIKFLGDGVGLDTWRLPTTVGVPDPKDFHIEFTDLLGKKHEWSGDYRVTDAEILKAK